MSLHPPAYYSFLRSLVNVWPKPIAPHARELWKKRVTEWKVSVEDWLVDKAVTGASGIAPWAFVRVKNELPTLQASLDSLGGLFQKGVIGYNECTDGSDLIIEKFCTEHPGFIPFHYPEHVVAVDSEDYAKKHIRFKKHVGRVLSICIGEYTAGRLVYKNRYGSHLFSRISEALL